MTSAYDGNNDHADNNDADNEREGLFPTHDDSPFFCKVGFLKQKSRNTE